MSTYTLYNLCLVLVVVGGALMLVHIPTRFRHLVRCARIATLVAIFSFPWDYFAIGTGVWSYPENPGPRLYGVPVNDMIFLWLCTFFTTSYLIWDDMRYGGGQRYSESEDGGQ